VAVGGNFFKLSASVKNLARRIKSDVLVKQRRERRRLMARLAWTRIVAERLEPLLLAGNAPRME
jgi:hypothetical protein